ncbi:MAG: ABC transporter permease [Myxococcales bacterium]|nr:ABC transporter permease [Myxococcales bacterium]
MFVPLSYNVRSLLVRRATTLATAVGIALVVFVLASALMLAEGVEKTMGSAGRPEIAIVVRKGSTAEMGSSVEEHEVGLVKSMPGVKKVNGEPIGVGEVVVVASMEKLGANGITNVSIRGTSDASASFRPNVKVLEGRLPTPGADEAMVGMRISGRIKGLALGERFDIKKNRPVAIVGVFSDDGSAHESEVWLSADIVKSSFGREGAVSSVRVELESLASFEVFQAAVEKDKRLGLTAMRETDYFEKQSEGMSMFIRILGSIVAVCFAIGAMIGAAITMYASIAHRKREIGILRALGFSRLGILASFLFESVLLALFGGVMGAAAAFGMGAVEFSMLNMSSWSEMVFRFVLTPKILVTSLVASVAMGLLGGLLPAIRAARTSPLTAMRG